MTTAIRRNPAAPPASTPSASQAQPLSPDVIIGLWRALFPSDGSDNNMPQESTRTINLESFRKNYPHALQPSDVGNIFTLVSIGDISLAEDACQHIINTPAYKEWLDETITSITTTLGEFNSIIETLEQTQASFPKKESNPKAYEQALQHLANDCADILYANYVTSLQEKPTDETCISIAEMQNVIYRRLQKENFCIHDIVTKAKQSSADWAKELTKLTKYFNKFNEHHRNTKMDIHTNLVKDMFEKMNELNVVVLGAAALYDLASESHSADSDVPASQHSLPMQPPVSLKTASEQLQACQKTVFERQGLSFENITAQSGRFGDPQASDDVKAMMDYMMSRPVVNNGLLHALLLNRTQAKNPAEERKSTATQLENLNNEAQQLRENAVTGASWLTFLQDQDIKKIGEGYDSWLSTLATLKEEEETIKSDITSLDGKINNDKTTRSKNRHNREKGDKNTKLEAKQKEIKSRQELLSEHPFNKIKKDPDFMAYAKAVPIKVDENTSYKEIVGAAQKYVTQTGINLTDLQQSQANLIITQQVQHRYSAQKDLSWQRANQEYAKWRAADPSVQAFRDMISNAMNEKRLSLKTEKYLVQQMLDSIYGLCRELDYSFGTNRFSAMVQAMNLGYEAYDLVRHFAFMHALMHAGEANCSTEIASGSSSTTIQSINFAKLLKEDGIVKALQTLGVALTVTELVVPAFEVLSCSLGILRLVSVLARGNPQFTPEQEFHIGLLKQFFTSHQSAMFEAFQHIENRMDTQHQETINLLAIQRQGLIELKNSFEAAVADCEKNLGAKIEEQNYATSIQAPRQAKDDFRFYLKSRRPSRATVKNTCMQLLGFLVRSVNGAANGFSWGNDLNSDIPGKKTAHPQVDLKLTARNPGHYTGLLGSQCGLTNVPNLNHYQFVAKSFLELINDSNTDCTSPQNREAINLLQKSLIEYGDKLTALFNELGAVCKQTHSAYQSILDAKHTRLEQREALETKMLKAASTKQIASYLSDFKDIIAGNRHQLAQWIYALNQLKESYTASDTTINAVKTLPTKGGIRETAAYGAVGAAGLGLGWMGFGIAAGGSVLAGPAVLVAGIAVLVAGASGGGVVENTARTLWRRYHQSTFATIVKDVLTSVAKMQKRSLSEYNVAEVATIPSDPKNMRIYEIVKKINTIFTYSVQPESGMVQQMVEHRTESVGGAYYAEPTQLSIDRWVKPPIDVRIVYEATSQHQEMGKGLTPLSNRRVIWENISYSFGDDQISIKLESGKESLLQAEDLPLLPTPDIDPKQQAAAESQLHAHYHEWLHCYKAGNALPDSNPFKKVEDAYAMIPSASSTMSIAICKRSLAILRSTLSDVPLMPKYTFALNPETNLYDFTLHFYKITPEFGVIENQPKYSITIKSYDRDTIEAYKTLNIFQVPTQDGSTAKTFDYNIVDPVLDDVLIQLAYTNFGDNIGIPGQGTYRLKNGQLVVAKDRKAPSLSQYFERFPEYRSMHYCHAYGKDAEESLTSAMERAHISPSEVFGITGKIQPITGPDFLNELKPSEVKNPELDVYAQKYALLVAMSRLVSGAGTKSLTLRTHQLLGIAPPEMVKQPEILELLAIEETTTTPEIEKFVQFVNAPSSRKIQKLKEALSKIRNLSSLEG